MEGSDPGCKRHYARMKEARESINGALLPIGGRVSYVGSLGGRLSAIWYFGKSETGFASGSSELGVVESIHRQIFGGL